MYSVFMVRVKGRDSVTTGQQGVSTATPAAALVASSRLNSSRSWRPQLLLLGCSVQLCGGSSTATAWPPGCLHQVRQRLMLTLQ